MASVQVRTGIREEYSVSRNCANPDIALGNTEKTENHGMGIRQRGKNETEHVSITSVERYNYGYHNKEL
jgi:hypothetical protein